MHIILFDIDPFQQIKSVAQYSYRILKLDNDKAANMLYVNGRLIHRTREEIGDRSYSVSTEIEVNHYI
jgi:hypothetical protein